MTEEKTEEKKVFTLVNVPTQHVPAIQTPEGELLTTEQAIVELLNEVTKIKNAVAA